MKQIVLVGFMGAGKTTIGRLLARELKLDFYDLDQEIVTQVRMSISDYFAQYGEADFRQTEKATLSQLLDKESIIATGGGIVTQDENRRLLKQAPTVIYLASDPQISLKRIKADAGSKRPIAQQKTDQEMIDLFKEREALYQEVADFIVETSHLSPPEVVSQIVAWKG